MRPGIDQETGAYRRGLILGLTMAELLLLLVFCLLIALSALLGDARLKLSALEEEVKAAKAEMRTTQVLLDAFRGDRQPLAPPPAGTAAAEAAPAGAAVDDTWDRLVAADGAVARLKAAGIDPDRAIADAERLKPLAGLLERKDAGTVAADVALADALRERLGVAEDAPLAADAVTDYLATARRTADEAGRRMIAAEETAEALKARVDDLADAVASRGDPVTDLPPIITLREGEGFTFQVGSAVPGPDFASRLHDHTAERLRELVDRYGTDVIEVVGHTDELPVARRREGSNLDAALLDVVRGGAGVDRLVPADNAGLGLARAVAVAKILASDRRLQGVEVLPLSAAQLVGTDGHLIAGASYRDEEARRRIEIRLRRSGAPAG